MLEMPLHLHIRSMYYKMRPSALHLIHLFLLIWLLITAWRLDNINNFLRFLPAPAWPAVFNVNRKHHVQKLVWEVGTYIVLQLVRCILLLVQALSRFELRTFEKIDAYIEHRYIPVLQLSTCVIPPKTVARAPTGDLEDTTKRMQIEYEYQLLVQFFVAKMMASKWAWDFNNSPLAPFCSSFGYLAMWIALQPVASEVSILKRMKMSVRLQEVLGIKKTSVPSYRSTPFKSITHQPGDEKWYKWCAKPSGTFWKVNDENNNGPDTASEPNSPRSSVSGEDATSTSSKDTTPSSSPISTNAPTIFEILGSKQGEQYVSSTADETTTTATEATSSHMALILLPRHDSEPTNITLYISSTPHDSGFTASGRPIIHPTSPSRLKPLSAPCLALSRNYIVAPLASKREHAQIDDYGSPAREPQRRTSNWVPDSEDDSDMCDGQIVELPEEKEQIKKPKGKLHIPLLTPIRLLDRPWPEISSTLGKRGVETRSDVKDEDLQAWEKWIEKVDSGDKMDDIRFASEKEQDNKLEISGHPSKKPRLAQAESDRFTYARSLGMPKRSAWDPRSRS